MTKYALGLLLCLSFFVSGQVLQGKETLSLVATASTAADTTGSYLIGDTDGRAVLYLDGTVNSGTATAVTITAQVQPHGDNTNWFALNGATSNTVGTVTAAQLDDDDEIYIVLSGLSWWGYAENVRFIANAASGTFNLDLIFMVESK